MNLEDKLTGDNRDEMKEAEEKSKTEKEAARRKARRAETKWGSMLEDGEGE
jgi:hypothetical protein